MVEAINSEPADCYTLIRYKRIKSKHVNYYYLSFGKVKATPAPVSDIAHQKETSAKCKHDGIRLNVSCSDTKQSVGAIVVTLDIGEVNVNSYSFDLTP